MPETLKTTTPLKYLSVCSGMEAASVAWKHLGWEPIGFSEIEPFTSAILKHHYPTTPNYGNITQYQQWPIEPNSIDILIGGTPCQSFSVAGKRGGLNDPRGQIMHSFIGIAEKFKPKFIIWENVPGVLSSGEPNGIDFATFLQGLANHGYHIAYRVLDAQWFGVAQRRRRIFVVGCLTGWEDAATILSIPESLSGYSQAGKKTRKGIAPNVRKGIDDGCGLFDKQSISEYGNSTVAATIRATEHKQSSGLIVPTILDRAAFNQGTNAKFEPFIKETQTCPTLLAHGPHAVQMPYRKSKRASSKDDNETWVPADVSNTLNNFDVGDTRTTHAVISPIPIQDGRPIEKNQNGLGVGNPGDPSYTLDTTGSQSVAQPIAFDTYNQTVSYVNQTITRGSDVEHIGAVMVPKQAIPIQSTIIGRSDTAGPAGVGAAPPNSPMYTLTTNDVHAVMYENHPNDSRINGPIDVAPTMTSRFGTGGGNVPYVQDNPMEVRRLTCIECERLQGFPDNYTQIPWRNKPAEQCPDGPRYKACGNSFAVPVVRWIGEQIQKHINGEI